MCMGGRVVRDGGGYELERQRGKGRGSLVWWSHFQLSCDFARVSVEGCDKGNYLIARSPSEVPQQLVDSCLDHSGYFTAPNQKRRKFLQSKQRAESRRGREGHRKLG